MKFRGKLGGMTVTDAGLGHLEPLEVMRRSAAPRAARDRPFAATGAGIAAAA